ncbi:MAG: hypothetical protein HY824_06040 [Acidobacteria bacterium]|nr:hypothetical protein [Acidobacteriota bacterium]
MFRLAVIGIALCATAAAAYGFLRLTFGARPASIHVRWSPAADDTVRRRLERQYALIDGEAREGRTWAYTITDVSRDNIRALVDDPGVEDTDQIHRTAYRLWRLAPRLPYRTPRPWVPVALEVLAAALLGIGAFAVALAALQFALPGAVRGPLAGARDALFSPRMASTRWVVLFLHWLRARIPGGSPQSAALFRIVFGAALLGVVLSRPVRAEWATDHTNALSAFHEFLLGVFRARPWLAGWVAPWVALWGGLFIAGAAARTAFALTALGVFAWALLYTAQTTYHTVVALLLTLACLLPARWSDAWSVDAWLRRAPRRGAPKEYGYTWWAPSLVLGVVFLAAAIAKLQQGGLGWILNGTVKYHFLSNANEARVDWGLRLARYHGVAVLLSFGAVAIEALVIVGVLSRVYRYRALAGLAAMSLFGGFFLFQGLLWPAWWMLLLSFLPWHLIGDSPPPAAADAETALRWPDLLRPAGVVAAALLIGLQIVVSALRLEMTPLITPYDMYSTTYESPADYEAKVGVGYFVVGIDDAGGLHECRITRAEADAIARAAPNPDSATLMSTVLRQCLDPSVRVRTASVEGVRARIDWARWRPEPPEHMRITASVPVAP